MLITQTKITDFVGSVEEIETREISGVNGKTQTESTTIFRFDRAGNLIERRYKDGENKKIRISCRYNAKNLCLTKKYFKDDLETSRYEYLYDEDGRLLETRWSKYGETKPVIHRLKYLKDGSWIEDFPHNPFVMDGKTIDGVISFKICEGLTVSFTQGLVGHYRKTFHAEGKLQKIEFFNSKKRLFGKIQVFYDIDGRPVEIWRFGDSYIYPNLTGEWKKRVFSLLYLTARFFSRILGGLKFTIRKEFLKALNCFRISGTIYEIRVSYDNLNRISKIHHFSKFPGNGCEIFSYDERGNPLERSSFWDSKVVPDIENCEYEYDKFDNWVKVVNVHRVELDIADSVIAGRVEIYRSIKYFDDNV